MAVTQATLTSGSSNSDATSYATASITPSADRLILAAVINSKTTSPDTPTCSGNGLTWVQVATRDYQLIASPARRITVFRALDSAPSAGAITFDFGGATQTSAAWSVMEFNGVAQGGTSGSEAVVQSAVNRADTGTSLTVTLAAFGNALNATYGAFGNASGADACTPGTGFTEIHDFDAGEVGRMCSEWRNDNDTTVDASKGGLSTQWGGIAVEIKARIGLPGRRQLLGVG